MVGDRFTQLAVGALISAPLSIVLYDVAQESWGSGWAIFLSIVLTASTIGGIRFKDLNILDVVYIFFTLVFVFAAISDIAALLPVCVIIDVIIAIASEFGID